MPLHFALNGNFEFETNLKPIYKVGRKYFDKAIKGDFDSLRYLFDSRVEKWLDPDYPKEIGSEQLFLDLLAKIRTDTAFELIPFAYDLTFEKMLSSSFECSLWFLYRIIDCSSTTEINKQQLEMLARLEYAVVEKPKCASALNEIKRHYRLS